MPSEFEEMTKEGSFWLACDQTVQCGFCLWVDWNDDGASKNPHPSTCPVARYELRRGKDWAEERAHQMAVAPRMWAMTRESYVAQLMLLLEVAGVENPRRLFDSPGVRFGPDVSGLSEPLTDEFALSVQRTFVELMEEA